MVGAMNVMYVLLCFQFYALLALCSTRDARIVLTMDRTNNLNPSRNMRFARSIFDYHLLNSTSVIPTDSDIVVHANWTKLVSIYKAGAVELPPIFANDIPTIDLFEDKAAWKKWMHSIGLGAYVPVTYNNTDSPSTFEYPLVLKTNVHFGRGVYIVTGPAHLNELVANLTSTGSTSYTLEEALTGMGLSEASSYGSVFNGTLLSMRCLKRSFSKETSQKSVGRSFNAQHTPVKVSRSARKSNSSLYIMGFAAKPAEQHLLPCSQEMVNVTRTMFSHTKYTGPFCSSIKLDQHMRPKMMEINARFCGPMATNEPLFVATFVPLAFTAGKPRRQALLTGPNKGTFQQILDTETAVLQSGGGVFQNKNISVTKFSHNLALDPITVESYFFQRKTSALKP